jgi:hypothetical protein
MEFLMGIAPWVGRSWSLPVPAPAKPTPLAHRVAHLIVNGADRKVPIIDTKASLTIHRDNEFNWIIGFRTEWDDCATGLQVTPP